jgi:type II secretory pathway component GspD/PulD (secretin)
MTWKKSVATGLYLLILLPFSALAAGPVPSVPAVGDNGFVANKQSVQVVFNALSSRMNRPVILSRAATKKQVSGTFDLASPWLALDRLAEQLSLIWYFDGQSVYVYDASETKNSVVSLHNIGLKNLIGFLQKSGLFDKRYPLKGVPGAGPFYVSGPPVYVDIIVNTAAFMDQRFTQNDPGSQKIDVIALRNTFVGDRTYKLRDQNVVVPGVATVIRGILRNAGTQPIAMTGNGVRADDGNPSSRSGTVPAQTSPLKPGVMAGNFSPDAALPGFGGLHRVASGVDREIESIGIEPVPENNSLLVKGRADQIEFIRNLVRQLDVAKRHVELALWIIDISKNSFDQLGAKWGASLNAGPLSLGINQSQLPGTTLDGNQFLAEVAALNQKGQADVVTRPVVLTQENVPALFDHSQTFYSKLQGERVAQLEHITYGTMISVLPRISGDAKEIEMVLNIEDGDSDKGKQYAINDMPLVRSTQISTVARVPKGKSLLIGGYALNKVETDEQKIPLLGDIPVLGGMFRYHSSLGDNRLRLFLIEPRVLENSSGWDADAYSAAQNPGSASSVLRTLEKLREYMDGHALK